MKDIDIARAAQIKPIVQIAEKLGVDSDKLELYGKYKAKLPLDLIDEDKMRESKLILVTAITPTPAGEGKTTTSIGLSQALNRIGKDSTVVLREPSLGPVFGIKGGAAGGGYSGGGGCHSGTCGAGGSYYKPGSRNVSTALRTNHGAGKVIINIVK